MGYFPDPPPTKRAFLVSNGYKERRATLHEFLRYQELPLGATRGPSLVRGLTRAYVYRCTETGSERTWGIE